MVKIDETDRAILSEMMKDSKKTIKDLAARLSIHPNTVLQRVKRLEHEKVILGYAANVDFEKLGCGFEAIVFINSKNEKGWSQQLRSSLSKIPEIQSLLFVTGDYDVLLNVRTKDRYDLARVLGKIQEVPIVTKTSTMLVLERATSDKI